ncbi:MAG: phosphoribosylanthranilate isomerase [Prevotella sp.]|nr:phosphoribosylanthranilate isomerase [Prevotella sp.]
MIIKVCGVWDAENIRQVAAADVDMLGFVFDKDDPHYVKSELSYAGIIPDRADTDVRDGVERDRVATAGVFADEMPQTVITQVYNYRLDYVQFGGGESRIYIDNLRRTLVPDIVAQVKIIKAFTVENAADVARAADFEGAADMFLFTAKGAAWRDIAAAYKGSTPFLLGGGINFDSAERLLDGIDNPHFAGINISGEFDLPDGTVDTERLQRFVEAVRRSTL